MLAVMNSLGTGKSRRRDRRSSRGSQLLEFGFALPILMLLVVGIWDFGSNFALKQKLTSAARQGARIVISTPSKDPANSTCSNAPCAVVAAATAVQQYLTNAGLNASWINPTTPSNGPSTGSCDFTWTYSTGTNSNYELDINTNVNVLVNGVTTPATQVKLKWPLTWDLASLFPAGTFPTQTSTMVTMPNLPGGGCQL